MAQWVRAVAMKVLGPEFRPQQKRRDGYGHVRLYPVLGDWRQRFQEVLWNLLATSVAEKLKAPGSVTDTVSRIQGSEQWRRLLDVFLLHLFTDRCLNLNAD